MVLTQNNQFDFKLSGISYYIKSFVTLLTKTNFIEIPKVLLNKSAMMHLKEGDFQCSNLMDVWTLKEVVIDNAYRLSSDKIQDGIVIDIGASIGDFSILSSKSAKKVYAFEMNPERIELFKINVKMNDSQNIQINHQMATTLNSIFDENHIKSCAMLKIDCEGNEYEIFNKTKDEVLGRIQNVSMEAHLFNSKHVAEYKLMLKRFKRLGFTIIEQPNEVHNCICYVFMQKKQRSWSG